MRFKLGDQVVVVDGFYKGKEGTVTDFYEVGMFKKKYSYSVRFTNYKEEYHGVKLTIERTVDEKLLDFVRK